MTRTKLLAIAALSLAACTSGPEQPLFVQGVALSLQVHLADPPTPAELRPTLGLLLEPLAFCSAGGFDPAYSFNREAGGLAGGSAPFDPAAPSTRVTIYSNSTRGLPCTNGSNLRFFRIEASLRDESQAMGTWISRGQQVAWSDWPVTLSLFGPDGPKVSLPRGYSVLHETCGPGGLALTADPTDRLIELHRPGESESWSGPAGLQAEQRQLLAGCGVTPPAIDVGARIGLDGPRALRWSADGSRLYYFVERDGLARLRAVPLAGGATAELAADLRTDILVAASSGDVFVGRGLTLVRGRPLPDGTLVEEPMPDRFVVPSPDGRWIAGDPRRDAGYTAAIYDVTTGQTRDLEPGGNAMWSPDSKYLAYHPAAPAGPDPGPVKVWSVDRGESVALGPGFRTEWLPGGQLILGDWNRNMTAEETIGVFTPDGGKLGQFHFTSRRGVHLWLGDRLVQLAGVPWSPLMVGDSTAILGQAGLELEDPARGVRRLELPTSQMAIDNFELAESPLAVSLSEGVAVFWMYGCLGFYRSVCSYQLHRLSLSDGGDQVVATAPALSAFALSPDHRRVAIGTPDGIFVKDLP